VLARSAEESAPPAASARGGISRRRLLVLIGLSLSLVTLCACQDFIPHDPRSVLFARFRRSEIIGFVAGFGTTFAALPDLVAMFRRRSSAGASPRMAAILGVFQILWIYYGLLIASRPVVAWNIAAVLVNFLNVAAYLHFARHAAHRRAGGGRTESNTPTRDS
jgi:MtN3 and saliva related transmembrane protein